MKNPFRSAVSLPLTSLTFALTALFAAHSVNAGNTWDGGGADGLWSNALNWDGSGVLPTSGAGQTLTFTGTSQLNSQNNLFADGTQIGTLTFGSTAGAFVLSGNSLALNSAIINNSTATQTINLNLILTGGNRDINSVLGSNTVIGGVISQDGSTARRFQVTGPGTATLNGTAASTYTGDTGSTTNGTLVIDLSNIAGNTNLVSSSSRLSLGNGNAAAQSFFVLRGSATGTSSQTMNGIVFAPGTAGKVTVDANGGSGTNLNLGTFVDRQGSPSSQGTLTFDISSVGSSLNGTTLGLTAGTQTASQGVRGYALVKDATGTGFAANVGTSLVRYTGATALTAGGTGLITSANDNYSLAAGGQTTTLATGQSLASLSINTSGSAGTLDLGGGTLTNSSSGFLFTGDAAVTVQNGQLGAANSEVIVHTVGTGAVNISSNISSGTGRLTKSGANALTVSGNNTYSGETAVLEGILRAGSSTAFSANSTYRMANSVGVGLDLNGFDVTVGALSQGGSVGGGITLGANTLTVGGKNVATTDYSGIISGIGGGVTKVGTGVMQVFGTNTYTGATNVNEGTFRARNNSAAGVGSAVTVGASGILDTWGTALSIGSLSGTGSVTNGSGTGTIVTGSNNTSTTFSGVISNGTNLAITKTGSGTQTFSGNNTYTGATNVTGGILKAGSTTAFGNNSATTLANTAGVGLDLTSSSVSIGSLAGGGANGGNVNLGANTLTVGGLNSSTVYGGVISGAGGDFTKIGTGGISLNGANTYTGDTTISAGSFTLGGSLTFAIGANGVNNSILGTGTAALNGSFTFDLALAAASGTWTIVDVATLNESYGAGFAVNGFTEITTDVWTFTNGNGTYTYTQATGQLTALAIPEPSSLALLGAGFIGLAARRSRRKN